MSERIPERWKSLRSTGAKALIPYVTPEYPVKGTTVDLVLGLEAEGASFIEIGVPFSDPLADGPVIQHASQIALQNGATPRRVLEIVTEIRKQSSVPILLMGYVNPLLRLGASTFLAEAEQAGVDGLIIPDLPPEESSVIHAPARGLGLSMVYLIAPTTTDERMRQIDNLSSDFSYCVSVTGVTGASARFSDSRSLDGFLTQVRGNTSKPFVVGFGIATGADVHRVWRHADGAVVGSQLLRSIEHATTREEAVRSARSFLRELFNHVEPGAART